MRSFVGLFVEFSPSGGSGCLCLPTQADERQPVLSLLNKVESPLIVNGDSVRSRGMRIPKADKSIARSSHEYLYTLMVKASTFSVYVDTNNTRMEPEGSLLIRFLSTDLLEPDELLQSMHSYPCLGNVEFLRWGIKPGSKKRAEASGGVPKAVLSPAFVSLCGNPCPSGLLLRDGRGISERGSGVRKTQSSTRLSIVLPNS